MKVFKLNEDITFIGTATLVGEFKEVTLNLPINDDPIAAIIELTQNIHPEATHLFSVQNFPNTRNPGQQYIFGISAEIKEEEMQSPTPT